MKSKLEYINVYQKRNTRNPIDWNAVEAKRNEGYELVSTAGNMAESIRNPHMNPFYFIFRKDEGGASDDELFNVQKALDDMTEKYKKLVKQHNAAKMRLAKYEKKDK